MFYLTLAIVFALLEAYFVHLRFTKGEYVAKPAVMILLLCWTLSMIPSHWSLHAAIFFSLLGDIFLMIDLDKMFLPGLVAFLLAHLAYIGYFSEQMLAAKLGHVFILALILFVISIFILRPVVGSLLRGPTRSRNLVGPVLIYGTIICIMTFSSILTLFDVRWSLHAGSLVAVGALLFLFSDVILAWSKFLKEIPHGRVVNILTYHAGQIGIVSGCILQHASD